MLETSFNSLVAAALLTSSGLPDAVPRENSSSMSAIPFAIKHCFQRLIYSRENNQLVLFPVRLYG